MFKPAVMTATALTISLFACTDATTADQPQAETATTAIPAFRNIYDAAWIRSSDGAHSSLQQAADELAGYDVVFFGEFHGHPGNHLAQMQMFQALHDRNPDMTLSLEQFERDTQPLVDQYLAGEIGEKVLTEDGRGWENYESSYRPLVEYARANDLPVIAANAPKSAVICVGKKGPEILDAMPQPDRGWVAEELHVEEGAYQDKYMNFIARSATHGGPKPESGEAGDVDTPPEIPEAMRPMALRSFSAQVTRDDTMAESIARHLASNPGRKVIHLNGNFHSASHLGTVERLKLRMPELKIAVINPVAVEDNEAPAWADEDAASGDFLLLIQEPPTEFVSEEREMAFQMEVMKKRAGDTCKYAVDAEDKNESTDGIPESGPEQSEE